MEAKLPRRIIVRGGVCSNVEFKIKNLDVRSNRISNRAYIITRPIQHRNRTQMNPNKSGNDKRNKIVRRD